MAVSYRGEASLQRAGDQTGSLEGNRSPRVKPPLVSGIGGVKGRVGGKVGVEGMEGGGGLGGMLAWELMVSALEYCC